METRRHVGYVPGDLRLFDRLTGQEQLDSLARVHESVDRAWRDALTERFDVVLDRPIRELSRGNRQKSGSCRHSCIARRCSYLTSRRAASIRSFRAEFRTLFHETVAAGTSVFLSSHSLDEVQHVSDRVAIIREESSSTSTPSSTFAITRSGTYRSHSRSRLTRSHSQPSRESAWWKSKDGAPSLAPVAAMDGS